MRNRTVSLKLFAGFAFRFSTIVVCILVFSFFHQIVLVHIKINNGNTLVARTKKYERNVGQGGEALILGDSLAYGVGASAPETSFAGEIAQQLPEHKIINNAVIGDTSSELAEYISQAVTMQYDYIFILIGGNDILRPNVDLSITDQNIHSIIDYVADYSDNIYLITTPNFSNVGFIPWMTRGFYSNRSLLVHNSAISAVEKHKNTHYIDTYDIGETLDYGDLQASDGFHLNDDGIQALVAKVFNS